MKKLMGGGDEFFYIMFIKCFYVYNIYVKGIYVIIIVYYVNIGVCYMYYKI